MNLIRNIKCEDKGSVTRVQKGKDSFYLKSRKASEEGKGLNHNPRDPSTPLYLKSLDSGPRIDQRERLEPFISGQRALSKPLALLSLLDRHQVQVLLWGGAWAH